MERVNVDSRQAKIRPAQSPQITVNACVISHRGCVRENNEDNFFFDGDIMQEHEVNDGVIISCLPYATVWAG